jgi:hypothetical protein
MEADKIRNSLVFGPTMYEVLVLNSMAKPCQERTFILINPDLKKYYCSIFKRAFRHIIVVRD